MKHLIAMDGGGTKTDTVLFDESGHILNRFVGLGCNNFDIGREEALSRIKNCIENVLQDYSGDIDTLYGGIVGFLPLGDYISPHLKHIKQLKHMRFDDDGCNLISGGIGHRDGCGMVCGTGCSLFVRIQGEPLRHIGGKGYLIDTAGSAFDLGQQAIKMAMRAVDGRIEHTILVDLLGEIIGEPVSDRLIPMIHAGGRAYIATFARAVFEGRKLGDKVSEEIFENGSAMMADLTFAAEKYFKDRFTVVTGGGIVNNYPEYVEAIRKKSSPRSDIILLEAPPVYGAAVEAMIDIGAEVTQEFHNNFLDDYVALSKK